MASSSNNSQRKYDVFVSFRGKDTRRGLVGHLEKALNEKKIEVFIDDKLKKGNEISPALIRAIKESDISLIVFSKCYADSIWCLEELVKILECKENNGDYTMVPIFCDVDPSTVRRQIGSYREAFDKHETSSRHDLCKLQSWRTALTTAANLSGLVSSDFKNDAELVEKIVNQVLQRLNEIRPPYVLTGLVGIQEQIEQLESLLGNGKQNVHIIGIWGMGGVDDAMGIDKEVVISLLDGCGLYPKIGLRVLEDRALITILCSRYITMHDLLQEMGRWIVYEESPNNPGKRRHLWDHDDIYKVLKNFQGTEVIESISLQCERVDDIQLDANAFKGMSNLKFLKFKCQYGLSIYDKSLDSLPVDLKYFYWKWYPLKFPPKLCLKNLVEFHMPNSKLERLCYGIQDLGNLKKINLCGSEHLKELPNMSRASKLKIVDLRSCRSLHCVHPSILSLRSLEYLDLGGCSSLKKLSLSTSLEQLKYLMLDETKLVNLPASIKYLSNLQHLCLSGCSRLRCIPELPPSIEHLNANHCRSMDVFTPNFSTFCPRILDLINCEKLGEGTIRDITRNFVYFTTMGTLYQQPARRKQYRVDGDSSTYFPENKISEVLDFLKRSCPVPETIQGCPNFDLMTLIICVNFCKLSQSIILRCSCFLQASNGARIQCGEIALVCPPTNGDHVFLLQHEKFSRNIINGIKESRVSHPKISFEFYFESCYDNEEKLRTVEYEIHPTGNLGAFEYFLDRSMDYVHGIKKIGVYPIYASELHHLFDTNNKSSQDTGQPQSGMKNNRNILAVQSGATSLKLSKRLLPHSQKEKKKSKKLKAVHPDCNLESAEQ
ncbi:hypothetical protein L6164_033401 [Bauhinia variegata]|uniref:Uncharacterized protein n=1 Tax=Bauhinia variegata TaxID=167791 RepID=A0ACB9KRP3_BAUVA|nr:hypothetical protein L6164_033401 [Bauhinia variegata]